MAQAPDSHDAEVDALYGLPLEEFTPARDALARELRASGDREAAARVKQLRKPSVAAWALNRARRADRALTDQLLEAGRRLREGQELLLAGQGREGLDSAAEDERRLVAAVARLAERQLEEAGRAVSGAVAEKLRATLHAAAGDPEAQAGLERGRLVRDHAASGLGGLAEAHRARGRAKPADAPLARRARRLEERLERARARRTALERERSEASKRLRAARSQAARVAAELERAELADEQASAKLDEAVTTLAELEDEARALEHEARKLDGAA
jgi:hypothetical protein